MSASAGSTDARNGYGCTLRERGCRKAGALRNIAIACPVGAGAPIRSAGLGLADDRFRLGDPGASLLLFRPSLGMDFEPTRGGSPLPSYAAPSHLI